MKKKHIRLRNKIGLIGRENPLRVYSPREMLGVLNQYGVKHAGTVERVAYYLRSHPEFVEVGDTLRGKQYQHKTGIEA
tara:strand:- start:1326 stop:1559 length:234 start_codon:yes stop_codon:yes gene_type:complete